jgi:carbon-monoxide dehydrogenase medium subunit
MPAVGAALADAARVFAGQMVRNTATVAGNICSGSPAADLVPPLLALDATVTLQSNRGIRHLPLADYFTGYKTSVRMPDELLTAVSWPVPSKNSSSGFYKLARRKGDAIAVLGVAVSLSLENGVCSTVRIALGCVGPCVMRAIRAEALLDGHVLTPDLVEAAATRAMEEVTPIDDVRASGEYRRQQVQVLVRRLLNQALENLTAGN